MSAIGNVSGYSADLFDFERTFDHDAFHSWLKEHWTLSVWYSALYVVLVFAGRHYMNQRPKFNLRLPLAIWSTVLAGFSIFGAIRTIPELVYMIRNYGFEGSVCSPAYFYGPTAFWAYLFTVSKLYELGDTAFIVLRKQPLIFLHWYHHVTVFIYVWYSYTDHTAPGRWFMVMNYTVHSFMYTYYALKAMRFRLPSFINIFITSIQILQMLMGVVIVIKAYQYKAQGHFCQQSKVNMQYCAVMYSSYLVLFVLFFYQTYLRPKPARTQPAIAKESIANEVHQNGKKID